MPLNQVLTDHEKSLLQGNRFFMIASIVDGKVEYLKCDSYSGGYPCWSSDIQSAERYDKGPNAGVVIQSYMLHDNRRVFLLEIENTIVRAVDVTDVKESDVAMRRKKLDAEIAELQRQRAELG